MKIAILQPQMKDLGGAENVILWMAESLSRKGHRIDIFSTCFNNSIVDSASGFDNVRFIKIGVMKLSHAKTWKIWIMSFLLSFRLRNYDIINPHNYPTYYWLYLARKYFGLGIGRARVKWVCHEAFRLFWDTNIDHGIDALKPAILKKRQDQDLKAVGQLDEIFANSPYTAQNIEHVYKRQARYNNIGVPLGKIYKTKKISLGEEKNFGLISRIERIKNLDTLLDVMKLLQNKYDRRDIRLIVGGEGPHQPWLLKRIEEEDIQHVVFKGRIPDKNVDDFYDNLRLVTYVPLYEPLGLISLEAGMRGKVVIGSSTGGPSYVIKDNETGFLVDSLRPDEIAEKILSIIDDDEKLINMGIKARNRVFSNFDFEAFIGEFLK